MREFWFAGVAFFLGALVVYTPTHVLPVMRSLAPSPVAVPSPVATPHVQTHFSGEINACEVKPGSTYFGGTSGQAVTLGDSSSTYRAITTLGDSSSTYRAITTLEDSRPAYRVVSTPCEFKTTDSVGMPRLVIKTTDSVGMPMLVIKDGIITGGVVMR